VALASRVFAIYCLLQAYIAGRLAWREVVSLSFRRCLGRRCHMPHDSATRRARVEADRHTSTALNAGEARGAI